MACNVEDTSWITDLEAALSDSSTTIDEIRSITKGKVIPDRLRADVWQITLRTVDKRDWLATFDEIFDLPEQETLRADCGQLVDKLGNDEEDKVSIVSDLESVLTCFSKSSKRLYESNNGWLEIVAPLLALKLSRTELYNCFQSIVTNYVPRDCNNNQHLHHLFRLLVLYHDPQLCSFLDTKKISPDAFAGTWFRSLFASSCSLKVIQSMWDIYFQQDDPFFVCFLALVILVNSKEQLLTKELDGKQDIIDLLNSAPSALEEEDVEDFCSLALYYYVRTPCSFKKDYHCLIFADDNSLHPNRKSHANQSLCLPVSVEELTQITKPDSEIVAIESVRFFLVDCRPAQQYNAGHLPTAFHLDANLMLQEPQEFATAVQALFRAQKQAIAAGSLAGGEHLCFMGSGREEEDQYVHMVVASFLQKHCQYVSMANGGYTAIHHLLAEELSSVLVDHATKTCIVCNETVETNNKEEDFLQRGNSIIERLSSVVRSKSAEMKEKMVEFITNPNQTATTTERHVSSTDKVGKRYRNAASVFTIDDDHDETDGLLVDEHDQEVVGVQAWLKKPDVVASFKCKEVKKSGYMFPCYLLVTETHLFVLRLLPEHKDSAHIASRRSLTSIVKITSKKKHPNLITFKYGSVDGETISITDLDLFLIPKASDATKMIRQQIMKLFDE